MPAAAVIQEEQAVFVVIGRKGYVDGFYLNNIKVWDQLLRARIFVKKDFELITRR